MEKNDRKKLFQRLPDKELMEIIYISKVNINGFRLNQKKPFILQKQIRSRLINEMAQIDSFNKIMKGLKNEVEKETVATHEKSIGWEILRLYAKGEDHAAEEKLRTMDTGETSNQNKEKEESKIETNDSSEDVILQLRAIIASLEEKEIRLTKEKRELSNKLNRFTKESEKHLKETEKTQRLREAKYKKLLEENKTLEEKIDELTKTYTVELENCKEKNKRLQQEVEDLQKPTIAIIGDPMNNELYSNRKIKIFNDNQKEAFMEQDLLDPFKKIWMLSFRVNHTTIRSMRKETQLEERITIIDDYQELKHKLEEHSI